LLIALAYVLLLAIVSLGVPLALSLRDRVNAEVRSQAQSQVDLVAATAADLLTPVKTTALDTLATTAARSARGRVIIVDRSGRVVADSNGPAGLGVSYAQRPEVSSALGGRPVQTQRHSQTLGEDILATAVPILHGGGPIGAVRVTQSVTAVRTAIRRSILRLGLIGLVVLVLGLAAGSFIAGQVARPLRRLERVARQIAGGDLTARAAVEGSTEQRSLAESFNEMGDRVARLLGSQRAFVADASHQLRTPLTGLRLRLEEARALAVDPEAERELDAAAAEVDRFAHIIDELLVLSRAGERELPATPVDVANLAANAAERWRKTADERQMTVTHEPNGSAGAVWCAPADAERALDALLENAIAYAPRGSTVTIAVKPARIEVLDIGPGLAEGEGELVFERFHRGRAGRTGPPGTGLGLAIARELAREWGGDVTLANRPEGGAVATLRLKEYR
jgi:signal transduction histidine kinase